MAEQLETIMEEREELMLPPKGGKPTKKIAHFIKPTFNLSNLTPNLPSISLPFRPISVDCTFNGWKHPTKSWVSWVDRLHSYYQFIWKRAGIYEAILSSRYKIVKNEDLFFGLAERWCCDTNTFVFPWGEATITLEDVMVLGGYSVLGDSVSGSVNTDQFDVIMKKLVEAHQEMSRGPSHKAKQGRWMKHFMELGSDTGIEHEAFLTCWLSRFVLPTFPYDVVVKRFFKIAIVLAGGVQISLAPIVLASIYRDLSLLKSVMVNFGSSTQVSDKDDGFDDLVKVTVWAPLQLVQVWAWERFPEFRPNPSLVEFGEPRLARWHGLNESEIGNVRPLLQSAGHSFEWRPYCKSVDNLPLSFFYRETAEWVIMDDVLGDDVKSMVRILRVCDLVGMDTIEQYSPNRVAMQFGFDQDVPEYVKRGLMDSDIPRRELVQLAWFSYINPTRDEILYVPSKFYEPQVTLRYLKRLRQGVLTRQAAFDGVVRKKRSKKKRLRRSQELRKANNDVIDENIAVLDIDVKPSSRTKVIGSDLTVPPGFPPKSNASSKEVDAYVLPGFTQKSSVGHYVDVPPGFMPKTIGNNKLDVPVGFPHESNVAGKEADMLLGFTPKNNGHVVDVPPGFVPKTVSNKLAVPPGFPCKSNVAGKEADVPLGFTPKNNVGHVVDVPPGFMPKPIGNNLKFLIGLSQKSYGKTAFHVEKKDGYVFKSEVVVKKECIESTETRQPAMLRCGYQTLNTSPAKIGSILEGLSVTKSGESSGKSELREIAQNVAHGREDQTKMDLLSHIRQLEKTIAELSKARSEKKFRFV